MAVDRKLDQSAKAMQVAEKLVDDGLLNAEQICVLLSRTINKLWNARRERRDKALQMRWANHQGE